MNETEHVSRQMTLVDYVAVLRRRRWVIIQAVVIVPVAALLFSLGQSAKYQATSDVLLSQQDLGAQLTGIQDPTLSQDPTRFVQNQAAIAQLPQVAKLAVAAAGVEGLTATSLLRNSHVEPDPNANRLYFSVAALRSRDAILLSARYAEAFRTFKSKLETAALGLALQQVENRMLQLQNQGFSKTGAVYTSLQSRAQELRTLQLLHTSNVLIRPASHASQIQPRMKRNVVLGAVLGLFIGIGLAFLWEAFDSTVRSADEVERTLGLPVLAHLATPKADSQATGVEVATASRGPTVEAFRQLRTNVEHANLEFAARVIMITSAVAGEGKSRTIVNLAASFAAIGDRVVIVDLDLRQPAVHRFFEIPNATGVVDIIQGRVQPMEALASVPFEPGSRPEGTNAGTPRTQATPPWDDPGPRNSTAPRGSAGPTHRRPWSANKPGINEPGNKGVGTARHPGRLEVLPAGRLGALDPTRILEPDSIRNLLGALSDDVDVVLIDTPPWLAVTDAAIASAAVDCILIVARLGLLTRPALRDLHRALDQTLTPRLGLVITGTANSDAHRYGYAYGRNAPEANRRPPSPSVEEGALNRD